MVMFKISKVGKRYYVNIDWVDNEGWKPVLVQTLN